jgi:hypothetical protein
MANEVFANGREISCKKADGKSICAFPDVCFTPPENPATPPGVPVPYPNTGMAGDTTSGSKTVTISGQEVMLKNKSYFKKSIGDEAGCAAKKGVVTSVNRGKVYFNSWSMDVKIENENAVRHLDITTHNHNPSVGNSPTWPYADRMAMAAGLKDCEGEIKAVNDNCDKDADGNVKCPPTGDADYYDDASMEAYARRVQNDPCQKAARCILSPYDPSKCCPPQTPHHLIPKSSFFDPSFKAWKEERPGARRKANCGTYDHNAAPCVCAEGGKHAATHGLLHDAQARELANLPANQPYNFGTASDIATKNMKEVLPNSGPDGKGCSEKCTKAQLRRGGHKGITNDTPINRKSEAPEDISTFRSSWKKTTRQGGSR